MPLSTSSREDMIKTGKTPCFSAVSLFAGCGGSDLGLRHARVETIWSNEMNEVACDHYEEVVGKGIVHRGDVRKVDTFPRADLLAGCYPCQGYSQGGVRDFSVGINYLYREFDRALRLTKPLAFIAENVDGMRFAQNRHLLHNQLTRFRLAGYTVVWKCLDAKDYGLAQDRKRIFLVGIRSAERVTYHFPAPTHGYGEGLTPYRTLKDVIWKYRKAPPGSYDAEPFHWYYLSRDRRRAWNEQAACILAHWRHVGLHPDSPPLHKLARDHWEFAEEGTPRRYSYLECAAIQGFPDPFAFKSHSEKLRFRSIGNAVPPPLFAAVADALVAQLLVRRERSARGRRTSRTPHRG
jgi:DNA (cytosine-5)-methyltransferase 1